MFETQLLEEAPKVEIKQELTKEEIIDCLKHYKYAPKNTNVRPKHLWNDYYRINCFKKVNNDNEIVKSFFIKATQKNGNIVVDDETK